VHELQILPTYFAEVKSREKRAEYRYNDRNFKVGDILVLREYENGGYTGRHLHFKITHILEDVYSMPEKWVILSIKPYKGWLKRC
jgi:hypothetical protein